MQLSRILLKCFGLVLACLFAVSASEARDAGSLGGGGGAEYRSQCPSGHAWFAYIGNAGTALDGIRALCTAVQPDKTTVGTAETDYHGGSGGSRIQRTCPANSVVTALRVWMETNKLVAEIDLTCTNLQTGAVTIQDGRNDGKTIPLSLLFSCNADEIGVGIYGRSGAMVDQIGLICEKLAVVQPALTPKPPPPAPKPPPPPTTSSTVDRDCASFADRMDAMLSEARKLSCAFVKGPGGWDVDRAYYVKQCLIVQADRAGTASNERSLTKLLSQCKSAGNGGGGGDQTQTMRVVADNTMYDTYRQPNKDLCYLHPGDILTRLPPDGNSGKWLRLSGNSGDCNGKTGYVWNDGELQ
ncbi:MAG: hypothetical protein GY844_28175 [Bradyrhizobium sp.]|nr:hypothetical protein [Bradyrhizobium sp.]